MRDVFRASQKFQRCVGRLVCDPTFDGLIFQSCGSRNQIV